MSDPTLPGLGDTGGPCPRCNGRGIVRCGDGIMGCPDCREARQRESAVEREERLRAAVCWNGRRKGRRP